jgi:hypothetical protein
MTLEALRDVLSSEYRGPRAVFSEVHVLKAIFAIGAAGAVGRGKLGSLVGLGQGEVRTLIKRLKENDLILIQPDGCRLSRKGEREFQRLREKIPWSSSVEAKSLGIGVKCAAVIVREAGRGVRKGIEQRDAAVRVGAIGAFTALFASGHFTIPGEGVDCEKDGPRGLWSAARAELGALSAALTLL